MSTEHSFPVVLEMSTEQLLAVVRFAYSQVVRNGWSKQDCTSYLTLIGFSRFACDEVYNYIVERVAFDMIAWKADRPERSEFLRSYSRVEDNSVWIYPFLRSYSRVEDNSVWITGYYSRIPPRNYSRQYRNEAMHNTYLGHLRYFWEGPCESNIPNRLKLGMIERSISSDDGGVDDASDEGYTDGLYPDFPKRWRKKEELAFEGGYRGDLYMKITSSRKIGLQMYWLLLRRAQMIIVMLWVNFDRRSNSWKSQGRDIVELYPTQNGHWQVGRRIDLTS